MTQASVDISSQSPVDKTVNSRQLSSERVILERFRLARLIVLGLKVIVQFPAINILRYTRCTYKIRSSFLDCDPRWACVVRPKRPPSF